MNTTENQELAVENAHNILSKEYFDDVREMAEEARSLVKSGEIADEEALTEWLDQSVDSSDWIIFTVRNFQVLRYSNNSDAFMDAYGDEGLVKNSGGINWAGMAFCAMVADVRNYLPTWDNMEKVTA